MEHAANPPEPDPKPESKPVEWYDVIVTGLFVIGVGLNVYLLVDTATEGQLSRQMRAWWERAVVTPWQRQMTFLRDREKVIAHATWHTMEAATDNRNGETS